MNDQNTLVGKDLVRVKTSRFRGPHPTFEPFLIKFKMDELEPPKLLLLGSHTVFQTQCSLAPTPNLGWRLLRGPEKTV